MSVSSMARLAEGDIAAPDSTLQSASRLIASYIHAESIAAYLVLPTIARSLRPRK